MTPCHQNKPNEAENGDTEAARIVRALGERGLDVSAVAFHLGVEPSTIYRWLRGDARITTAALTSLRLFDALHRVCSEAALAARVNSEESWGALVGGLQRTHNAAWWHSGFRDIIDGADS